MSLKIELSNLSVIWDYLRTDLIKKQRSFKIGLISIFLVVFFVALLMNVIELSPCIFLRLSEEQIGEADFIFAPSLGQKEVYDLTPAYHSLVKDNQPVSNVNLFQTKLINFTELQNKLKDVKFINGVAPRWLIQCNTTSFYNDQLNWAVSNVIILDSKLENQQGMGRKLHLPVLSLGEAYVSKSLYSSLKLDKMKDKNITISIKPLSLYKALQKVDVNSAATLAAGGQVNEDDLNNGKKRKKENIHKKSM